MKVLYDPRIFLLQVYGGISLYHCKLMEEFCEDPEVKYHLPLIYSDNMYIKDVHCLPYKDFDKKNWILKQLSKYLKNKSITNTIKELKTDNFDVYHPTYYDDYSLKHCKNKPLVITVHDMTQEILPEYFLFDKKLKATSNLKKALIQKASKVIAISENTKKDIIKICDKEENKIEVIHHGSSFEVPELLSELSKIPDNYILFVGSRSKYKNFNNFLIASSGILKEIKDLKLLLAGGPPLNCIEKELIQKQGVFDQIIYIPNCNNEKLAALYKKAVCFVYPSLYEGFGFPILEAFKCGCPVAISNTSCFPEIAGDAAVYFDPYDENSISDILTKLIQSKELRENIIEKGYRQIQKYSWKKTAEKTKEVYKSVV